MSAFKYLFVKEVRQFLGNRIMPVLSIFFPIILMLLLPLIATMEVKDVKLTVVDHDRSSLSLQMIEKVTESDYFVFVSYCDTYAEAMDEIGLGHCDLVLEIPRGFEKNLVSGNPTEVYIAANSVNSTRGSMGSGYLSSIVSDFASGVASAGSAAALAESAASPLGIKVQYRYNPYLNYRLFMVPALMIMVLIMLCGFFPTLNIVTEKSSGTIEQINVSPVSKIEFILSKVLLYAIVGLVAFSIALTVGHFVYGIASYGGIAEIYVAAVLFLLFMSGFGLIISNFSDTLLQAVFTMVFFLLIFMLMSGIFTSISSMAHWAKGLTYILPTRYFVEILRTVCLKGSTFSDLALQYTMLAVFATLINLFAVLSYRKQS